MANASKWLSVLFAGIVGFVGVPAQAQSGTEGALAETLYRQARELSHVGNYEEACPKFAESYRLDPATGTLLNLATCHEAQGKLATAWLEYSDALVASRRAGRQSRVKFAEERIALIVPRLSHLTVQVGPGADDPKLQISIDGLVIGRAAFGVPTPVDPGVHVVEAKAPGKKLWSGSVEVGAVADQQTVTVPPLESEPDLPTGAPLVAAAPPPSAPPARLPPPHDEAPARPTPTSVYVAGGTTIALAIASGITSGMYLSQRASFNETGRYDPDREAAAKEQDSLRTLGVVNAVLWIATAGSAALTGYLYFTRPEQRRETAGVTLRIGRNELGLSFAGEL